MIVPLTIAASSPFSGDHRALPVSMPPFCRRWTVSCPWLCMPGLPRRKLLVMIAFSTSLSARSFPPTPAHPGQYIHKSIRWWVTRTDTCQSGLPVSLCIFVESSSKLHWHGEAWPFSWFTKRAVSVFQILQTGCTDLVQETMTVRRTTVSATVAGVSARRDTTTPSAARPVWPVSCLPTLLWRVFVFHPVLHLLVLSPCRSVTYTSVTLVSVVALSFCIIHFCYTC